MKMIPGSGTISDYSSYVRNCTERQLPYKVPVTGLSDIQLFIDIGSTKPTTVLYQLIHTCGENAGITETISSSRYVIGQRDDNTWYGVFKDFTGAIGLLNCFVIAITLDDQIYFSDEYCVDDCNNPAAIEGCYGLLDSSISVDCNGIYFGTHAGEDDALGDETTTYKHKVFLRNIEVTLAAIKNTFKQGITRTFRTEKETIFQLWSEIIPEWYLTDVDAVLYRGEVNILGTRYLLNDTPYEKVDECLKQWKPNATFKKSCFQSFSCDDDPCQEPPESCCAPVFMSATVDTVPEESQSSGTPEVPGDAAPVITIESNIGVATVVNGTSDPVTGIADGSTVVSCAGFAGVRVFIVRGGLPLPGIDPGGGGSFYTKNLADNFITFSAALVEGEYLYIETIP